MAKTRIEIARNDIIKLFEGQNDRIYKRADIEEILSQQREFWRLPASMTVHKFIDFMLERTKLRELKFEFPDRNVLRYAWGRISDYKLVQTLRPNSYFTHFTAMYFNQLTEQIPKTIYLNSEQPKKKAVQRDLEQARIDSAFRRQVRVSNYRAVFKNHKICILNGMYTNQLGVIETDEDEAGKVRMTDIERTLIDATVRPVYSGGVFEVLKAYRMAQGRVSINKLVQRLKKLNYIYPYHQAIGFYLERAGYKEPLIRLLRKMDIGYDFYLTHQIQDLDYSDKWRLYFPKGF